MADIPVPKKLPMGSIVSGMVEFIYTEANEDGNYYEVFANNICFGTIGPVQYDDALRLAHILEAHGKSLFQKGYEASQQDMRKKLGL